MPIYFVRAPLANKLTTDDLCSSPIPCFFFRIYHASENNWQSPGPNHIDKVAAIQRPETPCDVTAFVTISA